MEYRIQIVPIGFEYERVLIGEKYFPSNRYYLLRSSIVNTSYRNKKEKKRLDEKLVELSKKFTENIKTRLETVSFKEVEVRDCSFITFEEIVKDLSKILKEIFDLQDSDNKLSKIYVNISTSTKLFASAMMYLASFFTRKITLFYVSSGNYTINLLLTQAKKEEIKKKFEDFGMTYRTETKGFSVEVVPVVPSIMPKINCIKILKILYSNGIFEREEKKMHLTPLLEQMGEDITDKKKSKSIRMKYRQNILNLKRQELIRENIDGKKRSYALTNEGLIFAIIIHNLYEFMSGGKT
jgi:transcriptional regulator CtsR